MHRILVFAFLFVVASPVSGFAAPEVAVEQLDHDFGTITQGETIEYSFRFQNAGDQVLTLGNVRTSCGCTAALLSSRRLAPGDVGELQIRFDSQGFRGKVHKTVEIDTNDPEHPEVTFNLTGTIAVELYATPDRISWGAVNDKGGLKGRIKIINNSSREVTLEPPVIAGRGLSASLDKRKLSAGETAVIDVAGHFSEGSNRIAGYVIIRTDFTAVPELRVPVSARLSSQ